MATTSGPRDVHLDFDQPPIRSSCSYPILYQNNKNNHNVRQTRDPVRLQRIIQFAHLSKAAANILVNLPMLSSRRSSVHSQTSTGSSQEARTSIDSLRALSDNQIRLYNSNV